MVRGELSRQIVGEKVRERESKRERERERCGGE